MRAALLDENKIVINVIIVDSLDFLPGLVHAENVGDIGDYWSGSVFIPVSDPQHPFYRIPEK